MFNIYFPIAEINASSLLVASIGFCAGVLSGLFGIGGGIISTPLLMFFGIPANVAVATSSNQIIASSFSGLIIKKKKSSVDFHIGTILALSGIFGSYCGIIIFSHFQKHGNIEAFISICYIILMGIIGSIMLYDSVTSLLKQHHTEHQISKTAAPLSDILPLKVYFPKSDIKISLFLPIFVGIISGMIVSLIGVGGGFIAIPAMIYILKMPSNVIVGTSLYQMIIITINVSVLHAIKTESLDIVLAFCMILGSSIGAQVGVFLGSRCKSDQLKLLLSLLILSIMIKFIFTTFTPPATLFEVKRITGNHVAINDN